MAYRRFKIAVSRRTPATVATFATVDPVPLQTVANVAEAQPKTAFFGVEREVDLEAAVGNRGNRGRRPARLLARVRGLSDRLPGRLHGRRVAAGGGRCRLLPRPAWTRRCGAWLVVR